MIRALIELAFVCVLLFSISVIVTSFTEGE